MVACSFIPTPFLMTLNEPSCQAPEAVTTCHLINHLKFPDCDWRCHLISSWCHWWSYDIITLSHNLELTLQYQSKNNIMWHVHTCPCPCLSKSTIQKSDIGPKLLYLTNSVTKLPSSFFSGVILTSCESPKVEPTKTTPLSRYDNTEGILVVPNFYLNCQKREKNEKHAKKNIRYKRKNNLKYI